MRNTITLVLLFVIINIILVWVHIQIFQSEIPMLVFASILAHVIALIYFPYNRLIKH